MGEKERGYVFSIDEAHGEKLLDAYIGVWIESGDDNQDAIRYCMVGKSGGDIIESHWVIFVQEKKVDKIVILGEGKCPPSDYDGFWNDFLSHFKEEFGEEYKYTKIELSKMDANRQSVLFEVIVKGEG